VDSGGGVAGVSCIDPSAHKERGPQDDSVMDDSVMDDSVMDDSVRRTALGRTALGRTGLRRVVALDDAGPRWRLAHKTATPSRIYWADDDTQKALAGGGAVLCCRLAGAGRGEMGDWAFHAAC